jgi:hypothetical protein
MRFEGKYLAKLLFKKIKLLTFLLLILTSALLSISFLHEAGAETKVISINPSSGYIGTSVQLSANITTVNGTYLVQFDGENVTSGIATENNVNASFIVPHAPEGDHNVTVVDVEKVENDTTTFTVLTSYSFKSAVPEFPVQLQQGANVTISINMTGGKSNYTYPNVTVQTPSGNMKYEALKKNITTNVTGDFYDNLTYPDDFSSGANTNFTGEYWVLFNETVVSQFFIGLTNSSEYHRGDIVNIKAVDYYPPKENITITIKLGDTLIDSINWTAIDGVVNVDWPVPLNATIGNYNLSITPVPNSKQNASDTQIFAVPGFKTEIFTLNLANKTVPNIFVKAYDNSAKTYYNTTTNENGTSISMLEIGDYSCEAFFKDVRVGEINFTVAKEEQMNFTCQLVTMNINVVDEQNISIPQVSISLNYNYTTNLGAKENKTGADYGETNIMGMLQLYSLLPNITYTINASRYGEVFNQGNSTISDLPATAYVDVTIFCPPRILQVNVTDAHNQPIANVNVKIQELMGGLHYDKGTDDNGLAVLDCTFGKYTIRVYSGEILLNETTVNLFQNQNISIICKIYGLTVLIKVVDYFGQPLPNANVTLQRENLATRSGQTQSDGTVTFDNITGGNLQIALYLPGQTQLYEQNSFFVDDSTTIQINIEKYVILAGFLIETSQLAIAIIIVVTLILVLSIEVYRRKRAKAQKSES